MNAYGGDDGGDEVGGGGADVAKTAARTYSLFLFVLYVCVLMLCTGITAVVCCVRGKCYDGGLCRRIKTWRYASHRE